MPLIVEKILIPVCVTGVGGQQGYEAGVQEDENLRTVARGRVDQD